jgi:hypothetical protein
LHLLTGDLEDRIGLKVWPSQPGLTLLVVDTRRGDGMRFVVRADEKLTAFVGFESATRGRGELA